MDARLEPVAFERIEGFAADDHDEAFKAFLRWAAKLVRGDLGPRLARPPSPALVGAARDALDADISGPGAARNFFETRFRAFRVAPADGRGFLTGYYEPIVEASAIETPEFAWPILARPADLVSFANESAPAGLGPGITGARRPKSSKRAAIQSSGCAMRWKCSSSRCRDRRGWSFPMGARRASPMTGATGGPTIRSAAF
jgi:membrane-bound lytic murein transglycosylase A